MAVLNKIPIVSLVFGLCLVSACGSPRVRDHSELNDCRACENFPGELVWDADGDGQDDFAFCQRGIASPITGSQSVYYSTVLWFIDQESKSDIPSLLYPLEPGMWISAHTVWNKYARIDLGSIGCWDSEGRDNQFRTSDKEWDGPFTGPDGDLIAFRLEGEDSNKVGVARIRLSPCDGWVDILSVRVESEQYGIFVGE